jgi:hypothetical protein
MNAEDYINLLYRTSVLEEYESLGTDLYVALYSSAEEQPSEPGSYVDSEN